MKLSGEHPGFFRRAGPLRLGELAEIDDVTLAAGADAEDLIEDIRPLDSAGRSHASFFDNKKYLSQLAGTRALACFVAPAFVD